MQSCTTHASNYEDTNVAKTNNSAQTSYHCQVSHPSLVPTSADWVQHWAGGAVGPAPTSSTAAPCVRFITNLTTTGCNH